MSSLNAVSGKCWKLWKEFLAKYRLEGKRWFVLDKSRGGWICRKQTGTPVINSRNQRYMAYPSITAAAFSYILLQRYAAQPYITTPLCCSVTNVFSNICHCYSHTLHWHGCRWKIETFILSEWLYCRVRLRGDEEVRKRFYAWRDEQKLNNVEEVVKKNNL